MHHCTMHMLYGRTHCGQPMAQWHIGSCTMHICAHPTHATVDRALVVIQLKLILFRCYSARGAELCLCVYISQGIKVS